VTHDLAEAIALADKIFLLSPRPAHVLATLDVPAPRKLTRVDAEALQAQALETLASARRSAQK
jgi:ABC-type nitrate/sulfonate/bicarbonate transport system ATPase subunit